MPLCCNLLTDRAILYLKKKKKKIQFGNYILIPNSIRIDLVSVITVLLIYLSIICMFWKQNKIEKKQENTCLSLR